MRTVSNIMGLAIAVATGCTVSPPDPPVPPPSPDPIAASEPPRVGPSPLQIDPGQRQAEAERLRALGLEVSPEGPVLVQPFARPWSRRSLVVPAAWFQRGVERLRADAPVRASALLRDLDLLEEVMSIAYSGWETAQARGWSWDRWFGDWRATLAAHGDEELALDVAFAPVKALQDLQLDNHTNIPLGLHFGSGSQSAQLTDAPELPCTRARHAGGVELALSPDDPSDQPRAAWRPAARGFERIHYIAYPRRRGPLQQVRCGARWLDATPAWSGSAPTAALARTDEDVPAYRRLSDDAVLVRLPTFSKRNGERLRAELPEWPARGSERALVVDLRGNSGGDVTPAALGRWIDPTRLGEVFMRLPRTGGDSCLYHALRWGYTSASSSGLKPPLSDAMRRGLQASLDALEPADPDCERRFVENGDPSWRYETRFDPQAPAPPLRVIALVDHQCGSDCELMVSMLSAIPGTIVVGTNSYGVAQYIQPGYSVLPATGLPYRIALGRADQYGDGRSFDGYGFDVDVLLTTKAEHEPDAIESLVEHIVALDRSR